MKTVSRWRVWGDFVTEVLVNEDRHTGNQGGEIGEKGGEGKGGVLQPRQNEGLSKMKELKMSRKLKGGMSYRSSCEMCAVTEEVKWTSLLVWNRRRAGLHMVSFDEKNESGKANVR